jgi:hypothetical protein
LLLPKARSGALEQRITAAANGMVLEHMPPGFRIGRVVSEHEAALAMFHAVGQFPHPRFAVVHVLAGIKA